MATTKVLLACSAGMSTSLLEKAVQDYAKANKLDVVCLAMPTHEAKSKLQNYDVVLLGPQVAFELSSIKKIAGKIPVGVIPGPLYAMAKGKETLEMAMNLLKGAQ